MALFCILYHPAGGIHTETCTECPPASSKKKDQMPGSPTKATDIGNFRIWVNVKLMLARLNKVHLPSLL